MSISNSFNQMGFGILVNSNRTILSIQETCHYQSKQKLIGFEVMGRKGKSVKGDGDSGRECGGVKVGWEGREEESGGGRVEE